MRIISGLVKGKKLAEFSGKDIRPTPDRVREAVFSILLSRIGSFEGKRVLDLFAGTGAMGLEALSRGAEGAVFVDAGEDAIRVLRQNLKSCRMEEKGTLLPAAIPGGLSRLRTSPLFDIVFLDPPYGKGLVQATLLALTTLKVLVSGALICAEAGRGEEVPETIGAFELLDQRTYGTTTIQLYSYSLAEGQAT